MSDCTGGGQPGGQELKGGLCQFLCNLDESLKHKFKILRPTAAFTFRLTLPGWLMDSCKTSALRLLEGESLECLSCYLVMLREVHWFPVPSAGGVLITRALSHSYYGTKEKSPWDKCEEPTPICPVCFCIHISSPRVSVLSVAARPLQSLPFCTSL